MSSPNSHSPVTPPSKHCIRPFGSCTDALATDAFRKLWGSQPREQGNTAHTLLDSPSRKEHNTPRSSPDLPKPKNSSVHYADIPQEEEEEEERLRKLREDFEAAQGFDDEDDDLFFRKPDQTTFHDMNEAMEVANEEAKKGLRNLGQSFGQRLREFPSKLGKDPIADFDEQGEIGRNAEGFTDGPIEGAKGHWVNRSINASSITSRDSELDAAANVFMPKFD